MEHFLMGAIAMASCVVAAFFVRFWRKTHDRLFALFATAFFLLGVTRLGLVISDDSSEASSSWYWVRLAAFLVILFAVVDKNRR